MPAGPAGMFYGPSFKNYRAGSIAVTEDTMKKLFSPFKLRGVEFKNRIFARCLVQILYLTLFVEKRSQARRDYLIISNVFRLSSKSESSD